jgi:hypothetical protein
MRLLPILAVAVTAVLATAPSAGAIESIQRVDGGAVPNISGTKAKPRAIALTVHLFFDTIAPDLDRQVQFATAHGELFFPKEGLTNNRLFPSCTPAMVLSDERQCPAGSRIGSGSARGVGLGLDEDVRLTLFNLPDGKGDAVLVVGSSPLIIRNVVPVTLTILTNDPIYKYRLAFDVPKDLQSPAPGVIAAIKDLKVNVPIQYLKRGGRYVKRKNGQRIPYIATTGCRDGHWMAKYVAQYTTSFDGSIESSQTVEDSVPCAQGR